MTSFRLVVTWSTERAYVRTYASTDFKGGIGETIKREGGCLRRFLGSRHLVYWTFTKLSIDSCQNRIATDQFHMTLSRAHVSTHRGDVIYLQAVRWPVNCFTRSRSMFNLIHSTGKVIMHTSIGHQCCDQLTAVKTGYPLTSITVSRAQVLTHRCQIFLWSYSLTSY